MCLSLLSENETAWNWTQACKNLWYVSYSWLYRNLTRCVYMWHFRGVLSCSSYLGQLLVIWINSLWIPPGSARAAETGADLLPHQSTAQQRGMVGMQADGHQPWPGGATGVPAHSKWHLTQTWHCSCKESLSTKSDLGRKVELFWTVTKGTVTNKKTGITCSSRRLCRCVWSEEQRKKEFSW